MGVLSRFAPYVVGIAAVAGAGVYASRASECTQLRERSRNLEAQVAIEGTGPRYSPNGLFVVRSSADSLRMVDLEISDKCGRGEPAATAIFVAGLLALPLLALLWVVGLFSTIRKDSLAKAATQTIRAAGTAAGHVDRVKVQAAAAFNDGRNSVKRD